MRGTSGIAVGGASLLVVGLLWWGTEDLSVGHDPDNRASALVPADGHRELEQEDGEVRVVEDARLTGAELVGSSPPLVGGALTSLLGGDVAHWRIWRSTATSYDATADDPEQSTTIRRVSDRGIEQLADYGAFTLVFDPPLLEVPADVHDGSTWSGTGKAQADGAITYRSQLSADEGEHGCLRVSGDLDLREDGQRLQDLPIDETWCPGRGVTGEQPASRPPAFEGSTEPLVPTAGVDDAAAWQVRARPPVLADSVAEAVDTGDVPTLVLDLPPAATADGGLVVANTSSRDVFALTPEHGALVRAWVGHPGGTVTALGSSGEVTVTGSTTRYVDAYGPHGGWLWHRRLSDVVVAPPLATDGDHLVLTTLAGDVAVVDPATGQQWWHARMSDQVRARPASDGDHVAVGDVAGQLSLFDAASGRARWTVDGEQVEAVGIAGDTVVVLAGGHAIGYRLADGTRRWARSVDGVLDASVVALGETVVVATGDETLALDADTGAVRWRADGADDTVGVGTVVAQAQGDRLVARDEHGAAVADLELEGLRGPVDLTPVADGLYATDADGTSVAVSR